MLYMLPNYVCIPTLIKVHVIIPIYVYVYIIAINSYIRLHTYITDMIYSIVCLRFLIASCVATSSYMITYMYMYIMEHLTYKGK